LPSSELRAGATAPERDETRHARAHQQLPPTPTTDKGTMSFETALLHDASSETSDPVAMAASSRVAAPCHGGGES
jgi:hypothetical protein